MNTTHNTMVCLSRRDLADGMAVTVFENETTHNIHVGLLDTDSGNYVDGSVRIYADLPENRGKINAYSDSLIDEVA